MTNLNELPLLLGKKHLLQMGLSAFQYYQLTKDPTFSVQIGAKRFIHRDRLMQYLETKGGETENGIQYNDKS